MPNACMSSLQFKRRLSGKAKAFSRPTKLHKQVFPDSVSVEDLSGLKLARNQITHSCLSISDSANAVLLFDTENLTVSTNPVRFGDGASKQIRSIRLSCSSTSNHHVVRGVSSGSGNRNTSSSCWSSAANNSSRSLKVTVGAPSVSGGQIAQGDSDQFSFVSTPLACPSQGLGTAVLPPRKGLCPKSGWTIAKYCEVRHG